MDIINFYLDPTGNSVKELNFPESGNWGNQLGMTVSTEVFFSKGFHYLQIPSTFKTGGPFPDTTDPWTWYIGALCVGEYTHTLPGNRGPLAQRLLQIHIPQFSVQ